MSAVEKRALAELESEGKGKKEVSVSLHVSV